MKSFHAHINTAINAYAECPPQLLSGMSAFGLAMTDSHSLTSRRFSIWSLLKKHVDEPFAAALVCYSGEWSRELLVGYRPSSSGRPPGQAVLDQLALIPAVAHLSSPAIPPSNLASADRAIFALERWIQCLRLSIHSCDSTSGVLPPSARPLVQALDLMREVLQLLERLRPRHEGSAVLGRLPDHAAGGSHDLCCELCWRPSMRWVATSKAPHLLGSRLKSGRFCEAHDPSDPKSRYRTDMRYKTAFLHELDAVYNFARSAFALELPGLPHPDEHMLRRLAYDRVHAGIRTPNARNKSSLIERVWMLHQEGLTQSDIARVLGISRQAVSGAMRKLKTIWNDHQTRLREYLLP